jgi:hypothetical protein
LNPLLAFSPVNGPVSVPTIEPNIRDLYFLTKLSLAIPILRINSTAVASIKYEHSIFGNFAQRSLIRNRHRPVNGLDATETLNKTGRQTLRCIFLLSHSMYKQTPAVNACSTAVIPILHSPAKRKTLLDLRNCQRGIQPLRTRPRTIENGVAPVQTHAVIQCLFALLRLLVPAVGDPAVGLEQHGGAEVFLAVPPVRGAGGAAASAQDAFVQAVEFVAVGDGLAVFAALR